MAEFSVKVLDHLNHPRHCGLLSEANIVPGKEKFLSATVGPAPRGEKLTLTLKLRLADELILDAGFQAVGRLPIPSASCFCEMIVGQTLVQALRIAAPELNQALDGLPEILRRQPVLAVAALETIVRQLRGLPPPAPPQSGAEPICKCFRVPEVVLERAVRLQGLKTVEDLTAATKAGGGCGSCHPQIEEIISRCERGEYKFHIPPADYEAAPRLYGAARATAAELARNPPADA